MEPNYLTEIEASELVSTYIEKEKITTTQEILNSNLVPALKGFVVRHGKVSDCIFGGNGDFVVPKEEEENYRKQLSGLPVEYEDFIDTSDNDKPKIRISFENPPLKTKDGQPIIIMVRTGRLSTHDIERGSIPFKDQILALNHHFMLKLTQEYIGTSQFDIGLPENSVVIAAEKLTGIDFENVLRGYMAKSSTKTSLYHSYIVKGERNFAGYDLPNDLVPNGRLPFIMDTPSTKDDLHDVTVPPYFLFENNICTPQEYFQVRNNSICSYAVVAYFLWQRNIIIADTKTEHGFNLLGQIVSQDELYTMDSSRFWLLIDYLKQLKLFTAKDEKALVEYLKETQPGIKEKDYVVDGRVIITPRSYSKEFARGYSVKDKKYTPEQKAKIAVRYIMGIQHLLQSRFKPDTRPWHVRVETGLTTAINTLQLA
jgi:phosphoribosylaminoimidazole-succinocarboxamide synthase